VTLTGPITCSIGGYRTIGSFVVDSLVPLGTVHFGVQADIGNFNGTVAGPAVPEPSSLLMLASGLLSLAGIVRRKLNQLKVMPFFF